jgi:hypothetical protein
MADEIGKVKAARHGGDRYLGRWYIKKFPAVLFTRMMRLMILRH